MGLNKPECKYELNLKVNEEEIFKKFDKLKVSKSPGPEGIHPRVLNPLRAKFLEENINIYLHFMSFLHADKTQVVEIPPRVRQGPVYSTLPISWLLMSWRRKEPGHQCHDIDLVKLS